MKMKTRVKATPQILSEELALTVDVPRYTGVSSMAEDIKTKIKNYKTTPFDSPFPNQNQIRNCWQKNYLDFHHFEKAMTTRVGGRHDDACVTHRTDERDLFILGLVSISPTTVKIHCLPSTHPYLQLHTFLMAVDCLHFEVDAHGADKGWREGVVSIAEEEGGLTNTAVANDEQFEHLALLSGPVPAVLML
ncbi:hypothetical protein A6R68_08334 [Neotoma lepida]|uniref:Uncharacterized protein n=1 Tax=Neotoma lepida TaxID=56216 RepID=A0A1A6G596_NEOLE|nr:hypothetical protein A6R68_08334 [Neotoma lepida]